jgi:hypothetical protein
MATDYLLVLSQLKFFTDGKNEQVVFASFNILAFSMQRLIITQHTG